MNTTLKKLAVVGGTVAVAATAFAVRAAAAPASKTISPNVCATGSYAVYVREAPTFTKSETITKAGACLAYPAESGPREFKFYGVNPKTGKSFLVLDTTLTRSWSVEVGGTVAAPTVSFS